MRPKPHPMQPIVWTTGEPNPIVRFQPNAIVRDLLDFATVRGMGLNEIARSRYSQQDREQLAQLVGYSVSGFGELPYIRRGVLAEADRRAAALMKTGRRAP